MSENQFKEKVALVRSEAFISSGIEHLVALAATNHINLKFQRVRQQTEFYILENLLKGYYIFLSKESKGSVRRAIRFNHNLDRLIAECRKLDVKFIEWLNLLPRSKREANESVLSEAELSQKYTYPSFYTMLEQGQSLKYGGVTKGAEKYKINIGANPNEAVDRIVKEIISKYGVTKSGIDWWIEHSEELKQEEKDYLRKYI